MATQPGGALSWLTRLSPPNTREQRVEARRYALGRIGVYGFLSFFGLIYLLPLFVVVANSFRELPEITQNGLIAFPHSLSFKAWPNARAHFCVQGT